MRIKFFRLWEKFYTMFQVCSQPWKNYGGKCLGKNLISAENLKKIMILFWFYERVDASPNEWY